MLERRFDYGGNIGANRTRGAFVVRFVRRRLDYTMVGVYVSTGPGNNKLEQQKVRPGHVETRSKTSAVLVAESLERSSKLGRGIANQRGMPCRSRKHA